jgi:hypothetical protein
LAWRVEFGDAIGLVPRGLAILSIGVVGLYLSKVFIDTENRPPTIVRAVHDWVAGGETSLCAKSLIVMYQKIAEANSASLQ